MLPVRYSFVLALMTIADATFLGLGTTTSQAIKSEQLNVYWNVPSFMCHKYGLKFDELKNYGIRQNTEDEFRGEEIAILYDPGMFPALLTDKKEVVKRNGGVPQEGDLGKHLKIFREHLVTQIPDESFSGIGVIDFESWRPIFRQNWASLEPYKTLSIKVERKRHPTWSDAAIKIEAKHRFEKHARIFMENTLKTAKALRPRAAWGYYGYPHCFNKTPSHPTTHCSRETIAENDAMSWLFTLEDIHMPSVYLRQEIEESDRAGFVKGRVSEAMRLSSKTAKKQRILPYYWFKYHDNRNVFLTQKNTENTIRMIANVGADGFIIWGSSNDTNTEEKCKSLKQYVRDVLGPAVKPFVIN